MGQSNEKCPPGGGVIRLVDMTSTNYIKCAAVFGACTENFIDNANKRSKLNSGSLRRLFFPFWPVIPATLIFHHKPVKNKISTNYGIFRRIIADQNTANIFFAVLIGLLGGFGAVGFRYLIWIFQELLYGSHEDVLESIRALAWHWRIIIPAGSGLLVGAIVWFLAREAKGHGVPEVMEAVSFKGGVIRKRIVAIKAFVSALCIASGGSAGREGPIVHIGSAIGSAVGQIGNVGRHRMRTFVACGASAGIAATFNAPIAGAFFSMEIILGNLTFISFGPVIVSSLSATIISRMFFGDIPSFNLMAFLKHEDYTAVHLIDYPSALALGVIAGLAGLVFVKILYKSEDIFDLIPVPLYIKAAFGGAVIGAIGLLYPEILGVGYESIDAILKHPAGMTLGFFAMLLVFKILGTSLTLGSGGSGGIFAPSLFMGAMLGAVWGLLLENFTTMHVSIPFCAMIGMGAFVSATTHAAITSILIIFEMTADYRIILPLMLACIISTLIAKLLMRDSIYTMKLSRRGVDYFRSDEELLMGQITVNGHYRKTKKTIPETMLFGDVTKFLVKNKLDSIPVVKTSGEFVGFIYASHIREYLFMEDVEHLYIAGELADVDVPRVYKSDNFLQVMDKLIEFEVEELPVFESEESKKHIGAISRRDIYKIYKQELMKSSIEQHKKDRESRRL